ncbi:MAG: hypothetical protein SGBAC_004638 [Bacillariaceae sp.]
MAFSDVTEAARLGSHELVIEKVEGEHNDQNMDPSFSATASDVPTISIGMDVYGNSVDLPLVGAGTWQYNDTIAYESVCKAIQAGYSFIDTAWGYKNQKGVGRALKDCWFGSGKSREDLFLMTKIPGGLNTSEVWETHQQNLKELQLDYVDHLMTHFPADWKETVASPAARQEEWMALEFIYRTGQARSIGVSHYCTQHFEDILREGTVMPSINQVEYHVGSQDIDQVMKYCADHNITFMSFSPLCGPCEYEPQDSLIHGDLVTKIASHYSRSSSSQLELEKSETDGISGSQVSLRYIVQQGIPVIPKSNTLSHMVSNRNIFDFELTQEDMDALAGASKPAAEGGDCDVP